LDKDDTKLSKTEKDKLNVAENSDLYKKNKDKIAKKVYNGVTIENIVKNMDTSKTPIESIIDGKKISIQNGTELAAWVQLYCIANDKSIYNDQIKEIYSLGIDAII
jgi:hypothetical protein